MIDGLSIEKEFEGRVGVRVGEEVMVFGRLEIDVG